MMQKAAGTFSRACWGAVLAVSGVLALYFALNSLRLTTYLAPDSEQTEYFASNILLCLALGALWVLVLFGFCRAVHRLGLARFALPFVLCVTFIVGLVWILSANCTPTADPLWCSDFAARAARNDWVGFDPDRYLYIYPYQTWFVSYIELLYRIFGVENFTAVQIFNLLYVCAGQAAVYSLTGCLCPWPQAKTLAAALGLCTLPWVLYTTFNYGNLGSLALTLWACRLLLYALEKRFWPYMAGVVALSTGAYLLKGSALVTVIAVCAVLALAALQKKSWQPLAAIALLFVCLQLVPSSIQNNFARRAGLELDRGTPELARLAMGLEEGELMAPGWFSRRTERALAETGYDYDATLQNQINFIQERLAIFASDPVYTATFFYKKVNSQWFDPTFGVFKVNRQGAAYAQWTQDAYAQPHDSPFVQVLDALQSLVYLGAAVGLFSLCRRGTEKNALCALVFFGGFLLTLLFEGKSQYTFLFYIFLLPYAARGVCVLYHGAQGLLRKIAGKRTA